MRHSKTPVRIDKRAKLWRDVASGVLSSVDCDPTNGHKKQDEPYDELWQSHARSPLSPLPAFQMQARAWEPIDDIVGARRLPPLPASPMSPYELEQPLGLQLDPPQPSPQPSPRPLPQVPPQTNVVIETLRVEMHALETMCTRLEDDVRTRARSETRLREYTRVLERINASLCKAIQIRE